MENWFAVKDGDPRTVAIYRRHYSCRNPKVDYCRFGFSGKGQSMVLLTRECDALFCWRLVEGEGIICSVFRNEGLKLSSELIKEAVELARQRWPGRKFITYVNQRKIKSTNPGFCFLAAGWHKTNMSKKGLVRLELASRGAQS